MGFYSMLGGGYRFFKGWEPYVEPDFKAEAIAELTKKPVDNNGSGLGLTIDNAGEWFNDANNMKRFETYMSDGSFEKSLDTDTAAGAH